MPHAMLLVRVECLLIGSECVDRLLLPVYTTVSGCIHYRHTVGTHAPAACSDVAANTTAVPCTV